MKVLITDKVSTFRLKDKTYFPGDIVEIEDRRFCPDFMKKIVEDQPLPTVEAPKVEVEKSADSVVRRQTRKLPEP